MWGGLFRVVRWQWGSGLAVVSACVSVCVSVGGAGDGGDCDARTRLPRAGLLPGREGPEALACALHSMGPAQWGQPARRRPRGLRPPSPCDVEPFCCRPWAPLAFLAAALLVLPSAPRRPPSWRVQGRPGEQHRTRSLAQTVAALQQLLVALQRARGHRPRCVHLLGFSQVRRPVVVRIATGTEHGRCTCVAPA